MPRSPEMYGASAKQEGSSLDHLRRDVSAAREVFAKQRAHDTRARKATGAPKIKESSGFSSSERTEYEEKLREYRKAVLEASKSETDPKKKAALLREALIDTTVKEADELWSAQRRMKMEAKGGSGAWEKMSRLANRTVEGYRKLSWKQKLAISGALFAAAGTGIAPVMLGATVGITAQRVLGAGSAAIGIDALVKRFGFDRFRINEIMGKDIRKEKDSVALAEKLSALLNDENNELNQQMLSMGGRKSREVALRGAAGAVIFGSALLGLPAKAIGQGVEYVAGDQARAVRSVAGRAVHKIADFFTVGSAEGSIAPGGGTTMARGGVLSTEEKLALDKVRVGVHNRMAFDKDVGVENQGSWPDETDRVKLRSSQGYPDETARAKLRSSKGWRDETDRAKLRLAKGWPDESERLKSRSVKGWLDETERLKSRSLQEYADESTRAKLRSSKGWPDESDRAKARSLRRWPDESARAGIRPKEGLLNADKLSFQLQKGGSVEGTINQYLKAHVEDIKANPQLQKALGWDGDPKKIGGASHQLWLKMVEDVRVHSNTPANQKLIEQLEKAGFHVKDALKDTHHPERLTKMFDAAARRMPIGMEFTINPKTGTLEFPDPRVGNVTGGIHEAADSTGKKIHHGPTSRVSSRLQEMLDEKHWQETDESMARLKQNINELKQSNADVIGGAEQDTIRHANEEIMRLEKAAEIAEQSARTLKRGDSQLEKLGFFKRERDAWLFDKTTRVQDETVEECQCKKEYSFKNEHSLLRVEGQHWVITLPAAVKRLF